MRTAFTNRRQRRRKQSSDIVRLIVTGLARSGKSQFIQSISQYTEWQDEDATGWFFGRVRVDSSLILHFLEPPIDSTYDFMWLRDIVSKMHATGFVVMVDSTRPQTFGEFLSIVYTIRGFHADAPLVVAANKQDRPNAWSATDLQLGLGIRDVTVLPCVAHDRGSVRDIVVDLLQQIPRR
jgi:signal recognition particle receptor subunit beta